MPVNRGPCKCHFCPDSFGSWNAVKAHAAAKHGTLFRCPECDREFLSEDAMGQHYDAKHCFECSECDDEFTTESARDSHYDTVHCWLDCPECNSSFKTKEGLNQHYHVKHRFECPECNREFTTQARRDQHYDAEHRMIECPACDREFKTQKGMDQHYDVKHRVKCPLCSAKFSTQATMDKHYNVTHRFECTSCPKHFTTERLLNLHRETCHRFRCPHCSDIFATEGERSQHCETKHHFPCPKCSETFVTIAELRLHDESEHKIYRCPKCMEHFKTQAALNQHIGEVHEPPPFSPPRHQPLSPWCEEPHRAKVDDTKSPPYTFMPPSVAHPDQGQENSRPNRFYCQETDCGRGFSTQRFLDAHNKFFHPKKPSKSSSTAPEAATGGSTPGAEKKDGEVEFSVERAPNKSPAPSIPSEKNIAADIATRFRCRICNKPPSVETLLAATACGHLFCYKCIVSKVTSTSKCPICNASILMNKIFKLDISC